MRCVLKNTLHLLYLVIYNYKSNKQYNKIYMQNNIMSIVDFNFEYSYKY